MSLRLHPFAGIPAAVVFFICNLVFFLPLSATGNDSVLKKTLKEIECLQEDVTTIHSISDLMSTLSCAHASLEESLKELLISLNRQLADKQNSDSQLLTLELTITSQ